MKKTNLRGFFLRKKAIKKREERIKKLKKEMEKKLKKKEKDELFRLFGSGENKGRKLSHVDLLKKITKVHELKDRRRIREENVFRKVEKIFKEKEKKKSAKEEKDIFERLKGVIKSK